MAGGVAEAIDKCIREYYPDVEVNIEHAEGLAECKKVLALAKAGKMNGCLIEGMGCPGGAPAAVWPAREPIFRLPRLRRRSRTL